MKLEIVSSLLGFRAYRRYPQFGPIPQMHQWIWGGFDLRTKIRKPLARFSFRQFVASGFKLQGIFIKEIILLKGYLKGGILSTRRVLKQMNPLSNS